MNLEKYCIRTYGMRSPGKIAGKAPPIPFLVIAACLLCLASPIQAQETIGGGTISDPAVGPAPTFGIGGPNAVLVKNWRFGANGTIKNIADMNSEFFYHDQFGTYSNGSNYGALTVAPDAANALAGQPIEGVNSPAVRAFFAESLQTYLQPLDGATTVDPVLHNAGCGSFMAKWELPYGGSWLGYDIVWETRVRYVTPPYFWFAIWTAGNRWQDGAEHDLMESFGYDNGGGNTNFDGRFWHANSVPKTTDVVNYSSWESGMASVGVTDWDPTVYHVWTWHYKADNTYDFYMDGIRVQYGSASYPWTLGANPLNQTLDMNFLFDGGWGHTTVSSVNHSMPASNFVGKLYEWNYSRVYLVPPPAAPAAPAGLIALPDQSTTALLRWDIVPYASSYNVYRGTSPDGESPTPIATGLKSLSFTDTGLTDGVRYYYKVAGANTVGTSALSAEVSVVPVETYTVDDADPGATYVGTWSVITSTPGYYGTGYRHEGNTGASGGKSAKLTPTLPATGYYDVYFRAPALKTRASNVPVDITHASGTATVTVNERINTNIWVLLGSYNFNSGTAGNVTIRNDGANGFVVADAVRWIPASPPTQPSAPSNLVATVDTVNPSTQINLAWVDNSSDETAFEVDRATDSSFSSGLVTNSLPPGANATSFSSTGLASSTTYYYRVRATNATGDSANSNAASATTSAGSGDPSLKLWLKLDETSGTLASDSSSNGSNGTLQNGPTWTTGQVNGGLNFDGGNDVVDAGSANTLDNPAAVTIAAWIKADTMGGGGLGRIVNKGNGTNPSAGYHFKVQTTNALAFNVDYATTDLRRATANDVIATGVWKHVAVTWNGSTDATNIHIYVDGVEAPYASSQSGVGSRGDDSATNLRVGSDSTLARGFDGVLDDVRVYNRVLTASEILILAQGADPSLKLRLKLDETSGTLASDSSGNGNSGTLQNGPIWTTGHLNGGLNFDGGNDVVDAGSANTLDNPAAVTIAAWIKADTMGGGGLGRIVNKGNGTNPSAGYHFKVQTTNALAFNVDYATTDLRRATANNVIATGVWKHVAVTWNGSTDATNIHIYVDGVEAPYASSQNGVGSRGNDGATNLRVGSDSTLARGFDGALDDVRVYNRVLTASEILILAQE